MSIKDYIKKYGNFSFHEVPFNDIDNILFSQLVYINFSEILEQRSDEKISLKDLADLFFMKYSAKEIKKFSPPFVARVIGFFRSMSASIRYQDVFVYNYVNEIEDGTQFGALTFVLEDGSLYVAFEGTDDSVAGWKEDFEMTYRFPVLAQKKAAQYLNHVTSIFGPKVRVGGHSKGGNLAMASYMLCDIIARSKVLCIYNNDGPGFRKREYDSKAYTRMLKKLKMFVPEECLVGMLLRHPTNYIVIKSSNKGVFQHDATSWLVEDTSFSKGKLSSRSKKIEKRVFNWICDYSDLEREEIVLSLFSILEKANVTGISEIRTLKIKKIISLIKENTNMDKDTRKLLLNCFKKLLLQKEKKKEENSTSSKTLQNHK